MCPRKDIKYVSGVSGYYSCFVEELPNGSVPIRARRHVYFVSDSEISSQISTRIQRFGRFLCEYNKLLLSCGVS